MKEVGVLTVINSCRPKILRRESQYQCWFLGVTPFPKKSLYKLMLDPHDALFIIINPSKQNGATLFWEFKHVFALIQFKFKN